MRYGMVIDLKRCIGCQACTVACKAENGTPPGVFFTRVLEHEEGEYPRIAKTFVPVLCNHCKDAPCEKVCPTQATHRTAGGIVLVDYDKCIGCRYCYVACPYNNRFFLGNDILKKGYYGVLTPYEKLKYAQYTEGTVAKCTFCQHRLQKGRLPACVETCVTGARVFGDLDDPASEVRELIRVRRGYQPMPELGTDPSVYYLD